MSAPYEEPENAELMVDTGVLSVNESADEILGYLEKQRILF